MRRYFKNSEFSVSVKNKKNSVYTKSYKYHPRLELVADVGRKVDLDGTGSRQLSHMIFVKRAEKKTIAQPTDVKQIQFYADVEQKISAKDGPSDLDEKKSWLESIRKYYGELGYETRLYYKSTSGSSLSGSVHGMIAEAADLLMCPKETIQLADKPSRWRKSISGEIASEMKSLLDKDSLWERAK